MIRATIVAKLLLLLGAFAVSLLANQDIPGYAEVDCLCKPGDSMAAAALRITGEAGNYGKLIAVHPKTGKIIRTKTPADYQRLPLGTKVYIPESLPPTSTGFPAQDRSILQICQQLNLEDRVSLNGCVSELVRINRIRTCRISALTEPFKSTLFVPNKFLSTTGKLRLREFTRTRHLLPTKNVIFKTIIPTARNSSSRHIHNHAPPESTPGG